MIRVRVNAILSGSNCTDNGAEGGLSHVYNLTPNCTLMTEDQYSMGHWDMAFMCPK